MADKSKGWTSLVLAFGWGKPEWWVGEGGGFYNAKWNVFHKHAKNTVFPYEGVNIFKTSWHACKTANSNTFVTQKIRPTQV